MTSEELKRSYLRRKSESYQESFSYPFFQKTEIKSIKLAKKIIICLNKCRVINF